MNGSIMTLFQWHMTAFRLAILLLWPLGFSHDRTPSLRWWAERPLWLAVARPIFAVRWRCSPVSKPRGAGPGRAGGGEGEGAVTSRRS